MQSQLEMVQRKLALLVPNNTVLQRLCTVFNDELDQALRQPPSSDGSTPNGSLKIYPTFVQDLPNGSEQGHYLALDLGGTNFRILYIQLNGDRDSSVVNQTFAISQALMCGPGDELFAYIANCVNNFLLSHNIHERSLMLGFTFSFPCRQMGLKQAFLSNWTKGFCCSGTVDQDVCKMLQDALKKYPRLNVQVAAIVNDTTGTLTSCAYMDPECRVGVIIGKLIELWS